LTPALRPLSGQEVVNKEVAKGTLRSLLRSAGLTVDEFLAGGRAR